jgi:hypothetical protein
MSLTNVARITRDKWLTRGIRRSYWNGRLLATELARLFQPQNRAFRRHVGRDYRRYLTRPAPAASAGIDQHARAAVQWLLEAQKATPDDGVPLGYFPCGTQADGWLPSYPETTGYIITSLLAYAERFGDDRARDAALRMARWEVAVQMPSGAVQGGFVTAPDRQSAAAFNTGMVLDGWCSVLRLDGQREIFAAARRAADFLVDDLDQNGYFRTNGQFVSAGEIKTYTCLCAWAIHRFGEASGEARYREAAVRAIEAALRQQQANGWFAHNCLTRSEAPLTHTIGYTLQGVLETGLAAGREDFVEAVRRGVEPLLARIERDGFLPGRFYSDWAPATFSSCLTGNAQIAVVCYRLFERTGSLDYRRAGDRLLALLKALQTTGTDVPWNGAIAGSFPLFGEYMRAGYPNWATKYFLDALLFQSRLGGALA